MGIVVGSSAFAETIFDSRKTLWDGLGEKVEGAQTSEMAIKLAGLDWKVEPKKIFTEDGSEVPDAYANVRDKDNKVLGVVGARYQIVQNSDAFSFTDSLLGEGVTYETAGALKGGKQIWLLAKLPDQYKILGDEVTPYLVFSNSFDGSGSIRVAMTPVRVWCKNTLNLALKTSKRSWNARHSGAIAAKLEQAKQTLNLAVDYMDSLNETFEDLYKVKLNKDKVVSLVDTLIPVSDDMTQRVKDNQERIKSDIFFRYEEAPDLKDREETGARFIQAISDSVSHIQPARLTQNYQANFFASMLNGNDMLDKAMSLVMAA